MRRPSSQGCARSGMSPRIGGFQETKAMKLNSYNDRGPRRPLLALLVASGLLSLATGCQNHVAQAASTAPNEIVTQAPFATPPVLAGTADIATLAAKVKPAVVNITTVHEMH